MKYRVYVDTTKVRNDGQSPVLLIFEDKGRRFKLSTGLFSAAKFSGREFPEEDPNHRIKTIALSKKLLKVDEYLILNEDAPLDTKKETIRLILGGVDRGMKPLHEFVTDFAKGCFSSTAKFYVQTAAKVKAFDPNATFNTVDARWLDNFCEWMSNHGNAAVNGRAIHIRNVKAVFNKAIDDGVTKEYPFRKYKIKAERVPINNISVEQLRELRDCDVEPYRRIYRDLFMLSFYLCGINPVDLLHLTKDNIKNGRIVYTRRKTHKLYDIPLPEEAKVIFERYHGEKYLLNVMDYEHDYVKFVSKWGKHLKELGPMGVYPDAIGRKRRKMGKPVVPEATVYSARYTFASIGAELEIPRETIALCLGHSWADVTSHYINYDMKRIDDAVRKIIDYVNSDISNGSRDVSPSDH